MVIVRFPLSDAESRGLGLLARRFWGRTWSTGEVMVPEEALAYLAAEGVPFNVEGPATYERLVPLRNPAPLAV